MARGSKEVESNEKHVYVLQDDGEPYEFDEGASVKAYEHEIAASSKPKAKKSKKGAPSSRAGAGGPSGTQPSRAPSRPRTRNSRSSLSPKCSGTRYRRSRTSAPAPKSGPS
jgi:hypothetical protein